MLFILALQHQMLQNNKKENNQYQTQLIKEAIQHQSYLLRESLLKEAKRMKRQLRRQERLIDIEISEKEAIAIISRKYQIETMEIVNWNKRYRIFSYNKTDKNNLLMMELGYERNR